MKSVEKCMLFLTLSALACGCGGKGAGVRTTKSVHGASRPVAKDATQEELLEIYNSFAKGVQTVNATVELKTTTGSAYSGVINEYHEVKAFLLAARPANIRMIGQAPLIGKMIFDMASNGKTFEVSIPTRNQFVEGSVTLERQSNKPIENMRPQHFLDALLWLEVLKQEDVLFEEYNDETARYYVLTVLRGGYKKEILRRIWFDRADLHVARIQSYGPKGVLVSDVRYADWQAVVPAASGNAGATTMGASLDYPRKISIDRTHDEYRLDLSVTKIALNEPIEAERFELQPPAGAEIVNAAAGSEEKKP